MDELEKSTRTNDDINAVTNAENTPGNNFTSNYTMTQRHQTFYSYGGIYPQGMFCPAEGKLVTISAN